MKKIVCHMDIKPELLAVYQFITTLLLGAFAMFKINNPNKFFSVIALALFIAHLLDVASSLLIIGGVKSLETDVLAMYVVIDIFTLIYLYHCFMHDHVETLPFRILTIFLVFSYIGFTIQDAIYWDLGLIKRSFPLYLFYLLIDISMLSVILWNEGKKDSFHLKTIYQKLKKKKDC